VLSPPLHLWPLAQERSRDRRVAAPEPSITRQPAANENERSVVAAVIAAQQTHGNAVVAQWLEDHRRLSRQARGRPEVALQHTSAFSAETSATGAVLRFRNRHTITIQTGAPPSDHAPFAYQFVPAALDGAPIVRIVAAPGVTITPAGFPSTPTFAGPDEPLLDIYRVQDPGAVPRQGTPLEPSQILARPGALHERAAATETRLETEPIAVEPRGDGIDVRTREGHGLDVTVPNLSGTEAFAYEITYEDAFHIHPRLRIVKTPRVRAVLVGYAHGDLVTDLTLEIWEVPRREEVPPQGAHLHPVGRELRTIDAEAAPSREQQAAMLVAGAVPVVGELLAVGEFFYAVGSGRDIWGRRMTDEELTLLGIAALVSAATLGTGGGAAGATEAAVEDLARATGAADARTLRDGVAAVSENQAEELRELAAQVQHGRPLTDTQAAAARDAIENFRGGMRRGLPANDNALPGLHEPPANETVLPPEAATGTEGAQVASVDARGRPVRTSDAVTPREPPRAAHTSGARPSTRQVHEEGEARTAQDRGNAAARAERASRRATMSRARGTLDDLVSRVRQFMNGPTKRRLADPSRDLDAREAILRDWLRNNQRVDLDALLGEHDLAIDDLLDALEAASLFRW
jgi:hypothetical protein